MVLYTSLFGLLAQLVEQLTLNQRVEGSSPSRPTNDPTPTLACGGTFLCNGHLCVAILGIRKKPYIACGKLEWFFVLP